MNNLAPIVITMERGCDKDCHLSLSHTKTIIINTGIREPKTSSVTVSYHSDSSENTGCSIHAGDGRDLTELRSKVMRHSSRLQADTMTYRVNCMHTCRVATGQFLIKAHLSSKYSC